MLELPAFTKRSGEFAKRELPAFTKRSRRASHMTEFVWRLFYDASIQKHCSQLRAGCEGMGHEAEPSDRR